MFISRNKKKISVFLPTQSLITKFLLFIAPSWKKNKNFFLTSWRKFFLLLNLKIFLEKLRFFWVKKLATMLILPYVVEIANLNRQRHVVKYFIYFPVVDDHLDENNEWKRCDLNLNRHQVKWKSGWI